VIRELLQILRNVFTWFVVVTPWERGVRVRFGRVVHELGPGIHLRVPFFDQCYKQSVRRRSTVIPSMTLTTSDGVTLTIGGFLWYQIDSVYTLYNTLHDAQETIESEAASIISGFVVANTHEQCRGETVAAHVNNTMDFARYGISGAEFAVGTHAAHRTLRLITGPPREWSNNELLSTAQMIGHTENHG
jgi:hypothetical protein